MTMIRSVGGQLAVSAALVVLTLGALLRLGLCSDARSSFDVRVPLRQPGDLQCLVDSLHAALPRTRIVRSEESVMVEHEACSTTPGERAWVTYGLVSGPMLDLGAEYATTKHLASSCRPALRAELRKAVLAYLAACDPSSVGAWSSTCRVEWSHDDASMCPDIGDGRHP